MQAVVVFTAQGSNTAVGNFAPGDRLRCGDALARHLVEEARVARYATTAGAAAASAAAPAQPAPAGDTAAAGPHTGRRRKRAAATPTPPEPTP